MLTVPSQETSIHSDDTDAAAVLSRHMRAEDTTDEHKQVMVVKRPLFPICFSWFFFYRTGNTYDKFVVSYLVPLITLYGSPTFVHMRVKKSL